MDSQIQQDLLSRVSVSLFDQDISVCECPLSADEISRAVRSLSKGKTPGSDGLPLEFSVKFWDKLCPILLQLYNFSFAQGSLSTSMKGSITCLIFLVPLRRNFPNSLFLHFLNL